MPYFSIQELLSSSTPFVVPGDQDVRNVGPDQELLYQYRLLTSLFVDESEEEFSTDHFGFLTPDEAREKYVNNYKDRFEARAGRVLGEFLQKVPPAHQQR